MMFISENVFFIAHRFLRSTHQHASIKTMIQICSLGILIATCSLALVVSIMTGFEQATYQKMQSIYPDLIVDGDGQFFDEQETKTFFDTPRQGIAAYTTQRVSQALMTYPESDQTPSMIMLRGVDSKHEHTVNNIEHKIIAPKPYTIAQALHGNGIMIGSKLAANLGLEINDPAFLVYTDHTWSMKFQYCPVKIAAIFTTGIEDFDANLVYCSDAIFHTLFPDVGITHLHIKLTNSKYAASVKNYLSENLNGLVYAWTDLYPTLLSALQLEKWAMFLILVLIVCVASMNIISLIFMYITHKQKDIVILMCMGMKRTTIRSIFIWISMFITIPATLFGLLFAWIIGMILKNFVYIKLPDNIYDTQYIPVQLELPIFCAILVITIIISLLASMYATSGINKINVLELLKTH